MSTRNAFTPAWKRVTPQQLKQGWLELKGATDPPEAIHHEYLVIAKFDDGTYVVRNPELQMLENQFTK